MRLRLKEVFFKKLQDFDGKESQERQESETSTEGA
jgi:hypothetical protein